MLTIDMSDLEKEIHDLSAFIESKTQVSISARGKTLVVDSAKETLSPRDAKTFVKQFLHDKGLSESFRVTEEHGVVRISRRKHLNKRKAQKRGTGPSPYSTMPYFFPH